MYLLVPALDVFLDQHSWDVFHRIFNVMNWFHKMFPLQNPMHLIIGMSIGPLLLTLSCTKMQLNMSTAKLRPFGLGQMHQILRLRKNHNYCVCFRRIHIFRRFLYLPRKRFFCHLNQDSLVERLVLLGVCFGLAGCFLIVCISGCCTRSCSSLQY